MNCLDNTIIEKNKNNKLRPITSIAANSLFTGAKNEPSLGSELVKEINTAELDYKLTLTQVKQF